MDEATGGAISAIVGAGANLGATAMQNTANRKLAKQQRKWNEWMWDKQNAYNLPSAQMQRLKDAGLNPRLIYGSGSSNTGVSSSPAKPYQRAEAQRLELGTPFQDYVNIKYMGAQTDNVRAKTETERENQLLKIAQTAESISRKSKNIADVYKSNEIKDMSLQAMQERVRQIQSQTTGQDILNTTASQKQQYEVQLIKNKVEEARETVKGVQLANKLKGYEAELNKIGLQKTDPLYMRLLWILKGEISQALDKTIQFKP